MGLCPSVAELAEATNLAYQTRIKARDVAALEELCGVRQRNEELVAKAAAEEEAMVKAMAVVGRSVAKMHKVLTSSTYIPQSPFNHHSVTISYHCYCFLTSRLYYKILTSPYFTIFLPRLT